MKLYYCSSFPNNSGIQAVVVASTSREAQSLARDAYYGKPALARPATEDELDWHLSSGGSLIGDRRKGERRKARHGEKAAS